ncbi:MAG: preprotein translocase subunit SecA [Candidatus Omnitrophica bacterium]|nr:preprotein translocase subunit SecA [Candidatus Omnitrophota bacterium]
MINFILQKIIGTQNERALKLLSRDIERINSFEPPLAKLTDQQLKAKTVEFKDRIAARAKDYEAEIEELLAELADTVPEERQKLKERLRGLRNIAFDEVIHEAFAAVREAGRRNISMRHFDAQLIGGLVLHSGRIAEMATGEGKTLVATLPVYLNALLGKGVHIITVNDYLARRDREWMGPIYEALGLSVGVIQHDMSPEQRRFAYSCDITYGTNNEFGFDYLRDNMVIDKDQMVQRPFYYAVVDEVDSILIDEARTPLIISGPAEESTDKYYIIDKIIPKLKGRIILEKDEIDAKYRGEDLSQGYDYIVDEKAHTAHLTADGEAKACQFIGIDNLHEIDTMEYRHHIIQALRAHNLYKRDVDYVVKDGEVLIVDEFTGRLMPGRRWSDGLHQAVEAKEGVKIERENQTLATITLQNYFKMYERLSGMTGTAATEAQEFKHIYGLDVVTIPTNRPLIRTTFSDAIYKTQNEKFSAVVEEIAECNKKGRPVLVGTISIAKSEHLSELLKRKGIEHNVLNAKYHEMEAQIVAQAGRFKAVTIATNMAGRGTDILLGGNPEYMAKSIASQQGLDYNNPEHRDGYRDILTSLKAKAEKEHNDVVGVGGLHVIGTERHEARRIDNQLRGRTGRQGDPGSSRFFVSLGDDLMRLFGSDRIAGLMEKLGMEEGQVIEHPWVTKSIEIAQKRVEQHNFEIRKRLLEYDNVMNRQREIIYNQRREILEGEGPGLDIEDMVSEAVDGPINRYLADNLRQDEWDWDGLLSALRFTFSQAPEADSVKSGSKEEAREKVIQFLMAGYRAKIASMGPWGEHFQKMVFLQVIDTKWKDHLYAMDNLREGIGLRAYGQRDPLIEYQHEGYQMFQEMIAGIKNEAVEFLFKIRPAETRQIKGVFTSLRQEFIHPEAGEIKQEQGQALPSRPAPLPAKSAPHPAEKKVGRNDPCPCGSGKKYKRCCGK